MKKILFVAMEHGSFNVVYPLFAACGGIHAVGYIGRQAIPEKGIWYKKIVKRPDDVDYGAVDTCDTVVTGSSASFDVERNFWRRAAAQGVTSICILDQHKEVPARFGRGRGRVLPDRICVMNSAAKRALRAAGIDDGRIVVTGSPHLKAAAARRITDAERERIRKTIGVGGGRMITVCTEYIVKEGGTRRYGCDEYALLDRLLAVLARLRQKGVTVYIRVHPNDSAALYRRYVRTEPNGVTVRIMPRDPAQRILQASK